MLSSASPQAAAAPAAGPSSSSSSSSSKGPRKREPSHWVEHGDGLPAEPLTAVAIDPDDDRVVYAGLDGFLFRSDDGGDTFAPVLSFARGLANDGLGDSVAASIDNDDTPGAVSRQGAADLDDGTSDDDTVAALDDAAADPDVDDVNVDDLTTASGNDVEDTGDDSVDDLPQGSQRGGGDDTVDAADLSIPGRVYPGVRALAFVPGQKGSFYVATSRGLFRTVDDAHTFTAIKIPGAGAENDIRDVVVDPMAPSRIFIATAAGLWSSGDGGVTLERSTGVGAATPTVCLAIDRIGDATWIVLGTEAGLLRSRDNGATFLELLLQGTGPGPVIHAVTWARDGSILYAGTGRGLFAAEREAPILEHYAGIPPDAPTAISIDPGEQGGIAVALARRSNPVVFSDDTGLTLVEVDRVAAPSANSLARETRDPARLWVATDRGLFRLEKGTGISLSRDGLASLRSRFQREPPLEDVVKEALEHHGLIHDDSRAARVRWAGILPRLQVRFDGQRAEGEVTTDVFVFNDGTIVDDGTLLEDGLAILRPSTANYWRVTALLSWDLDRLILNPDEAAVFRSQPGALKAEQGVVDRVRELYVTRRRMLADMEIDLDKAQGKKALVDNLKRELKLQEIEASLAAIVGSDVFDANHTVPSQQEQP